MANRLLETKEPSFLRKLKSEYGGGSSRHERPLARPRRQKAEDEEDDGPTYVQEETQDMISKEEYAVMLDRDRNIVRDEKNPESVEGNPVQCTDLDVDKELSTRQRTQKQQQLAVIGAPKKRKMTKVVGDDQSKSSFGEAQRINESTELITKPKKSKKKIKLSFDDDDSIT